MDNLSAVYLLRIVFSEDATHAQLDWFAFDAQQRFLGSDTGTLNTLPKFTQLHWILPASILAGHVIAVPEHAGRHQAAAITQTLEDELLGVREAAHVVIGRALPNARQVWVCQKKWLSDTLGVWVAAGMRPTAAYPVYALLPLAAQTVSAQTAQGVIFQTPSGQTAEFPSVAVGQAVLGTLAGALTEPISDLYQRPLPKAASNLLVGEFSPPSRLNLAPMRVRNIARLGALALCLLVLSTLIGWQQLEWRTRNLKAEIRQTFAATFPGTPLVDPALQWASKLREGRAHQSDSLDQLSHFAQAHADADISPLSLEFRDELIRVLLSEGDLARLRSRLQQGGQEFSVQPAEPGFSRLDIRARNTRAASEAR